MTSQPGDDTAFAGLRFKISFNIQGQPTTHDIAAIETAVRRLDPAATVVGEPPEPFVEIITTAQTAEVLEAIQGCGLVATLSKGAPAIRQGSSIFGVLGTALVAALLGAILIPILTLLGMLVLTAFDPVCGTPGDSGGCAMGVAGIVIGSVPVGAVIGFLYGIYRSVR